MKQLPTVKHGFMGRLAKEISFTTEEQYDEHIIKLLKIISEGGHILVSTTVSMSVCLFVLLSVFRWFVCVSVPSATQGIFSVMKTGGTC